MKERCLVLDESVEFYDAIKKLDDNGDGVLPIIDKEGFFIGLITDGDIRKAILNKTLDLHHIINKHPYKFTVHKSIDERIVYLKKIKRRHLPIVDDDNRLVDIFILDSVDFQIRPNTVVIMAGGLGTRLGELTKETPKPMLKVGNKPLLEELLRSFIEHGFHKFYISVNYKKEIIMDHFKDGSKWGVNIEYLIEDKRLGTAGSLSLIQHMPTHPLIVINGDVVTTLDYNRILGFHIEHHSKATMCIRKHEHIVPYGVIEIKDSKIVSLSEKPKILFNINTGIYVIEPDVIKNIPPDTYYDMTTLFDDLGKNNQNRCAYLLRDYWIDIGGKDEFFMANVDVMPSENC
jgi:dTDP-glucose pyrophosphorylase